MTMKDVVINKKVLVRSDASGVHFGTLVEWEHDTVHLRDSRRLWAWNTGGTGISLSEIAICGVKHETSKITMPLPDIIIVGVCEIIPCHGMAIATIETAEVAKP
jgi:hypothetical protein